jgi:hypothetical protein
MLRLRAAAVAAGLTLAHPAQAGGQVPTCSPASPSTSVLGREASELPVDRVADLLALEPGVTSLNQGDLSVRGAGANATSLYLDGVPVSAGRRGLGALAGGSYFGSWGSGIGIGTNGFAALMLVRGVSGGEYGSGRGGVIKVITGMGCGPDSSAMRSRLRGGWATDALFGRKHGLGFNRVTLDGDRRMGRFTIGGAAVLEGQSTARLGLDQNDSPVFVADGVDTTVTVGPGNTPVDVLRFRRSDGIRIPSSTTSSYTLHGRAGYELGAGQRLQLSGYGSQSQQREFDYENLYNPRQLRADRIWSRVLTGSWFGRLRTGDALTVNGEAHLSWQTDRAIVGPLSIAGEKDSRAPFGGFLLGGVGFRFDLDNFAVNDGLVRNFRTNTGRLSPYDLNNTTQYSLIDQYRNNAYGLTGFSESGGPVGRLTLFRENRLVGKGVVDLTLGGRHHGRVGAELVRYDLNYYSSNLTSQALSDAYVESPTRMALFGDYDLSLKDLTVSAGVRYDRFRSGASRPVFPRISSAPGFDPVNPTSGFVEDKGHARVSPRVQLSFVATPKLTLYGGVGSVAQLPDFAALLSGINTDLSVTTTQQPYGSDLGFEYATLGNVGARYQFDPATFAEADLWTRQDHDVVALDLVTQFDPLRGANGDIIRYRNTSDPKATGVDLRVGRRLGARGQAWLGYAYSDVSPKSGGFPGASSAPVSYARPHTLTGALLYQTGADEAALAGVLRNVGVYAAVRFASGTAYTRCPISDPGDVDILSDDLCTRTIVGNFNGSRLPTLKLVDLRLTRGISLGATHLVVFADVRNLFNTRNLVRVFAQTGTAVNDQSRDVHRRGNLDQFAEEATANGVLGSGGDIDLSFGGAADPRAACGAWTNASGTSATPNCVYLLGAEARWGNGDHLFTIAEQTRASDALYYVGRGLQQFTGSGRRVRLGLEVRF